MDYLTFFIVAALYSYKFSGEGKTVDSTVKLANNMILKCVCPKNGTISLITWSKKKDNGKDNIAVLQLPRNLHIESKYQNRVDIVKQTSNNKSLVFTNATEADIGYYHCSFTLFPQGIWEKRIHVVQSGDFEPHVLPAFHLAMKLERRANFTCQHDSEVAVNQVIWEKVQVDSVDLVVQCDESGTAIRGAEYEERVEIDCANRASSTMTLENVTASDFGIYRCHYIGANGENTTGWIKLENTTGWIINGTRPLDYDQAVFFIAGGTVTATILLIILLASVVAVHQQRKISLGCLELVLGPNSTITIFMCVSRRKRKRAVTTKPFNVAQKQDSTRYGRPGFQVRQNANGERNAGTLATVQDPVYVNYRVGSHKTNEGV